MNVNIDITKEFGVVVIAGRWDLWIHISRRFADECRDYKGAFVFGLLMCVLARNPGWV